MKKTAIFSISSLGLGHATRTLPVVQSYIRSHRIHIVSHGNTLAFLKKSLSGSDPAVDIVFHDLTDYPPIERGAGKGWKFYWYMIFDSVRTVFVIKKEHAFIAALAKEVRPEFIFSDGRYGSYAKGIPSFILCHQISFIMPKGLGFLQGTADRFNKRTFKNFDTVFIPDYETVEESLGGRLSHHDMLSGLNHRYVGILSSLSENPLYSRAEDGHIEKARVKDIDFLFSVSGYLSEHKDSFINTLIEQAKGLPGKKVFILGEPKDTSHTVLPEHGIEIHSSASGDFRRELFARAGFVISRAGYTTVMDLAELDLPGLLIPTPGQTEQEYLAAFHGQAGHFLVVPHHNIDLKVLAEENRRVLNYFKPAWKTSKTIEKIRKGIADRVSQSH